MSDKVTVDIAEDVTDVSVTEIPTSVTISDPTNTVTVEENTTTVNIAPVVTTVTATEQVTTVDISENLTTVGIGDASIVASNLASTIQTNHDSGSWVTGASVQASFDNLATTADSRYVNVTGDTMTGQLTVPRLKVERDNGTAVISLHDNTDDDDHIIYLTGMVNSAATDIFSLGTNSDTNQFQLHSYLDRDFEFTFGSDKHVDAVATISTSGLDVAGTITFDGGTTSADLNVGDDVKVLFGEGSDLQIFHDSSTGNSKIREQGSGNLIIEGRDVLIRNVLNGEAAAKFISDGTSQLHFDGSKRIETTTDGISVTGTLLADKVGIGTTNPTALLDVKGTGGYASGFSFKNSHDTVRGYFGSDNDNADFLFTYVGTNSAEVKLKHNGNVILCESGGNVGINKPAPQTALDVYGTITGTTFSGDLNGTINTATTATTQSQANNSTKVATTAYVDTAVAGLVDGAPGGLNTLNELAAALEDDVAFSTTVTNNIGTKLAKASNLSDLADAGTARTNLGLGTAATINFDGAYSSLTGKPTLFSGDYTDLSNKPTLFSGDYTDLSNKPTLYSDSAVDTHLNQSTAGTNEVLSWTGTDYAWVPQSGGIALTSISVNGTEGTADGDGGIAYDNTTGVFTYTPPDLSSYLTTVAFSEITTKPTTISGYGITDALQLGTTSTTALAGDTELLQLGTTSTTALAGDTALLQLGTTSTTALAGDTALLQLGTTSTTALAGDTALLQLGTTSTTALAGDTELLQLGTTSTTALAGDTALLQLGTTSTTALAGDTALLQLGTTSTTALAGDSGIEDLSNVSSSISPGSNSVLAYNSTASEYQPYLLNDVAEIENQYIEVSTGAGVIASRPYYASAWDGANNRPIVSLTDADNEQPCIGIATETVGSGSVTKLLTKGILTGLNTSTTFYPGTGNLLYVSSSQGGLTRTAPVSYQTNLQQVATVLKTDTNTGVILVDITASQVGVANLAHNYIAYGGPNGEQTALYDDVSLPIRASAGPSGSREYWNVLRLTDANNNYTGDINHIQIGQAEAEANSQLVDKISLFPGSSGVRIHNSEAIGTEGVTGQTLAFHTTDDGIHVGNDRRGTYTAGDLMSNNDTDFGMLVGHDSSNVGSNNFGFGSDLTFETNTANNLCIGALNTVNDTVVNSFIAGGSNNAGVADSATSKEAIFIGGRVTNATNSYSFSWGKGNFDQYGNYPADNNALGGILFGEQTKLHTGARYALVGGGIETSTNGYARQQIDGEYSISWGRGINLASSSDYTAAFGRLHECTGGTYSFLAGEDHDAVYNKTHFGAIGKTHKIEGNYSFAAGLNNNPIGDGAVCLGASLKTPLFQPVGGGNYVWDNYSVVVGAHNDPAHKYITASDNSTWVEDHRFVVGTGTSSSAKANGFIVAVSDADFSGIIMPALAASTSHSSGSVAKAAGVPVGGLYHTNGVVKVVLAGD